MSLHILSSGPQTSVQDFGRAGHRHCGVPLSGAADKLSFALTNFCAGNSAGAAGLEMTLQGAELIFDAPTQFALGGANIAAKLNGKALRLYSTYAAKAGDQLSCGAVTQGARSYLAINGGVKAEPFLGSLSTYINGQLGGFKGRALNAGDIVPFGDPKGSSQTLPRSYVPRFSSNIVLRAMAGPEFESLTLDSQNDIFKNAYAASRATDRMGARLSGPALELRCKANMSSSPILPGTVQIPPSGNPILMLADGHCIGGYPRALQIIRADRWLLGQIKPNTIINFQIVTADEAHMALKRRTAFYQSLMPDFSF